MSGTEAPKPGHRLNVAVAAQVKAAGQGLAQNAVTAGPQLSDGQGMALTNNAPPAAPSDNANAKAKAKSHEKGMGL